MTGSEVDAYSEQVEKRYGIPAFDPLGDLTEITKYVRDNVNDGNCKA